VVVGDQASGFVGQRVGLLDFWAVYDQLLTSTQQTSVELALRQPGSAPVSDAAIARLREHSHKALALLRQAIEDGDWSGYRAQIRELGGGYAELGVSLEHWYGALRVFQLRLAPALVEAYGATPARLSAALTAAAEFIDMVTELVTERYFAVREEDRFRLLVESVKDYAIYLLDPEGVITSWNAGAAEIKGYAPGEVVGHHFAMFFPPAARAAGRPAELLAIAAARGRVEEEAPRVRKDGSQFWADVVITAIRGDGNRLVGFAKVVRDLTERRDIKAALEARTRELELSNRELEAFSYSVAHDLRAPLRAIAGFSQVVIDDHAAELSREAVSLLTKIEDNAKRMAIMIDGLLDLSRLARSQLQLVPVDLGELAREVVDQLAAGEPGRAVEVRIAPELTAHADPRLARTLLENLLGNAWKFTRKAAAPRIEVGAADDHRFFVRDNGAGFDLARAEKLFMPFERLHRDPAFPGTGIGLAIVRRIVDRHGGDIRVDAHPGQGATFTFSLATAPA
jgi:PAS domain S-box-containing protein